MPDEKTVKTTRTINYSGNSYASKAKEKAAETPAREKIEKVVTGEVIKRKKPLGRRLIESFTGDDASNVGRYILEDVFIPALKNLITDATSQGVERFLFGDSRPRSGSTTRSSHVSYNRMYGGSRTSREEPRRTMSQRGRATHDFSEIILQTRAEAETVLDILLEAIDKYDVVSVAELYDAVGITGSFSDDKWGWTDLRSSGVRRVREGYLLELPAPETLD